MGLGLVLGIALFALHEPRPEGREGEEAALIAAHMERAVDLEAWERTGAVRWTFAGRQTHLWDRERELSRVTWGDVEVLQRLDRSRAVVTRGGEPVSGDEARGLSDDAYAHFINDSFWLNPVAKFRDDGVTLARVGEASLLVSYASGGLTPGDAYLWRAGEDGTPRAWQLWVSVIPVGGVEVSWEGWTELSTGARVSTRHVGPLGFVLEMGDVAGAATLTDLIEGADPFDPLLD